MSLLKEMGKQLLKPDNLVFSELERKADDLLGRGVVEVINKESLRRRLLGGERLRIKLGIDPTGPNIHLGRGATLQKLRDFQDLGHQIVLIIGDATAAVGDSSDKFQARKKLKPEEIVKNERNYLQQIGKVLDIEKTEVHHNSEWLSKLTLARFFDLARLFTVQQIIERENFSQRIKANDPVGLHETLYCLLQGWDSIAIKTDVEIGGTDQLFNLLAGRKIQENFGQRPQDIITLQLLAGTDGRKMSTSWGNVILINDPPEEKYGRLMRISDQLIPVYMECVTRIPMERVDQVARSIEGGKGNPMDYKKELALEVVKLYDGIEAAEKAQKNFEKVVQKREIPEEAIPTALVSSPELTIAQLIGNMVKANLVRSKSEGRRLIEQGGVSIGEEKLTYDPESQVSIPNEGIVVRVGKRKFLRFKVEI